MPTAQINDIELYYQTQGCGEPLVMISGFGGDHTLWSAIKPLLTPHYQVITFDNRGAGQSSVPAGPYSMSQMADDVIALCDHLSLKQSAFIGSSMGGMILQNLLSRYPERASVGIISNSSSLINTTFQFFIQAQYELLTSQSPAEALIKASLAWGYSYDFLSQPGMLESMITLRLNNPHPFTLTGYAGQMDALRDLDNGTLLPTIPHPCLVISADEDIILPHRCSVALLQHLSNATSYCFTRCGHSPQVEQPELYASIVKEFLAPHTHNTTH